MQIIQGSYYQGLSNKNRIRLIELPAARGNLLDRYGEVLVGNRPVYDVVLIPQEIPTSQEREKIFDRLAEELKSSANHFRQTYQKQYRAPFAPIVLSADISKEQAIRLEEQFFQVPGVFIQVRPVRYYHQKSAGAHLMGYLGEIDRVELRRLKSYGYKIRDLVGQAGIEQDFDLDLRGENGGTQVEVDHKGKIVRVLGHRSPARGKDIQLTLDARLQAQAQHLLEDVRGAIIVMDPWTGEILAMTSSPSFDPNAFIDKRRQDEIEAWLKRSDSPFLNRALAAYVPGSIFKIVTATAGLEKGRITPNSSFVCSGVFELGGHPFRCWREGGHGPEDLSQALTHSCNVYFYHLGLLLGVDAIHETAKSYGLGQLTGIGLTGEAPGLVPSRRWKLQSIRESWYDGETVNFAIGQGYLLLTPIQVVRMIAAVANGGQLVQPYLLKRIGSVEVALHQSRSTGINPQTLKVISDGLKRVIADPTGTGQLAHSAKVSIAGKTATAETSEGVSHAWFIGFAPIEKPQIAIVIFIEHGGAGGLSAAPRARQLVESYLGN